MYENRFILEIALIKLRQNLFIKPISKSTDSRSINEYLDALKKPHPKF